MSLSEWPSYCDEGTASCVFFCYDESICWGPEIKHSDIVLLWCQDSPAMFIILSAAPVMSWMALDYSRESDKNSCCDVMSEDWGRWVWPWPQLGERPIFESPEIKLTCLTLDGAVNVYWLDTSHTSSRKSIIWWRERNLQELDILTIHCCHPQIWWQIKMTEWSFNNNIIDRCFKVKLTEWEELWDWRLHSMTNKLSQLGASFIQGILVLKPETFLTVNMLEPLMDLHWMF